MGISGIGIWQLLIILAIVLLLFGGKRLRNLGGDLGTAIKGFKNSMKDGNDKQNEESRNIEQQDDDDVIDVESEKRETNKHS